MAYCQYSDINVLIDSVNLNAMTDDYGINNGLSVTAVVNAICQQASNQVDAFLSPIYPVPFVTPPALVKQASIIFAAEICYMRRLTPAELNPFKKDADMYRERLKLIGSGDVPLDESYKRGFPPVIFKVLPTRADSNIY